MTEYSNPLPPEGINNSERRPLLELLRVAALVFGLLGLLLGVLALSAQWLAARVPFAYETALAAPLVESMLPAEDDRNPRIEAYLQGLADRLAAAQGLPPEMSLHLHYLDEDTVNAVATLGGHVLVYRGLLARLPHENALAMVLSHELAHVRHRDPMVALGRTAVVGIAVASLAGVSNDTLAGEILGSLIGEARTLSELGFSRTQERAADEAGLAALVQLYGHTGGAADLFRVLAGDDDGKPGISRHLEFLETHPDIGGRIDAVAEHSRRNGWATAGALRPLPKWLVAAVAAQSAAGAGAGQHPKGREPAQTGD